MQRISPSNSVVLNRHSNSNSNLREHSNSVVLNQAREHSNSVVLNREVHRVIFGVHELCMHKMKAISYNERKEPAI